MQCALPRPGSEEAKTIKRAFDWQSSIRDLQRSIAQIQEDLRTSGKKREELEEFDSIYDPDHEVKKLERLANAERSNSESSRTIEGCGRLKRALSVISRRLESPLPRANALKGEIRNDWAEFDKFETERRQFVEASYRRYRLGAHKGPFEAVDQFCVLDEHISVHPPSDPTPICATQAVTRISQSTNTEIPQANLVTLPLEPVNRDQERKDFVSRLVSSKTKASSSVCGTVAEGQAVEVCYYGIHFPGEVIGRNFGNGTLRVRFNDGTINDFPISSVTFR